MNAQAIHVGTVRGKRYNACAVSYEIEVGRLATDRTRRVSRRGRSAERHRTCAGNAGSYQRRCESQSCRTPVRARQRVLVRALVSVAKRPKRTSLGLRVRQVEGTTIRGYRCTSGVQTIIDLAEVLDDITWEHALENVLRDKLTTVAEIEKSLHGRRVRGASRIRRVLALRPQGAPPTESLLETLAVQLIRSSPELPEPTRQVEILNKYGEFVARVDLAWPELGVFIELDAMGFHKQPVYDSRRETAVVAATGWLPARFTWHEVRHLQRQTSRRLGDVMDMAKLRPPATFWS